MKNLTVGLFVIVFSFSVFAQVKSGKLKTVELLSPINEQGIDDPVAARKSCFSFVKNTIGGGEFCGKSDLYYGGMRLQDDWDWLQAMGVGSRNKIVNLGEKKWTDKIKVPVVEPYAKLNVGERRNITVDTSGSDGKRGEQGKRGKSGEAGRNSDGTYNPEPNRENEKTEQINDAETNQNKEKVKSVYFPLEKAVLGNMYAMRVVDNSKDFYVLFRVEELEKGKRCKISWKKVKAPKAK